MEAVLQALKLAGEYGLSKVALIAVAWALWKIGRPMVEAWVAERQFLLQSEERARQSLETLMSNHLAHVQAAVEALQKETAQSNQRLVAQLGENAKVNAETIKVLGSLHQSVDFLNQNMRDGFTAMTNLMMKSQQ